MSDFYFTRNDLLPTVRANLSDYNGYVDLTNGTGYFIYKTKYGTGQPVTGNTNIIGATSGYLEFIWSSGNVSTAGVYNYQWRASLSNGKQISFPNDSYLSFAINPSIDLL